MRSSPPQPSELWNAERLGWVIYSPETDDYLGQVADGGAVLGLRWCRTPEFAMRWDSVTEAERVAFERVEHQDVPTNRRYPVEVFELLATGDQLVTRRAAQVVPRNEAALSAADLRTVSYSSDFRQTADRLGSGCLTSVPSSSVRTGPPTMRCRRRTFVLREVRGLAAPRHLLVIVDASKPSPEVLAAWPVPASIGGCSPTPIGALDALCRVAGHPVRFRGEKTPLVLGESLPMPRDLGDILDPTVDGVSEAVTQLRIAYRRETDELAVGWVYNVDDARLLRLMKDAEAV